MGWEVLFLSRHGERAAIHFRVVAFSQIAERKRYLSYKWMILNIYLDSQNWIERGTKRAKRRSGVLSR